MANPRIKERHSPTSVAGQGKDAWLGALEQGANLLQETTPLKDFDVYVVGFHCAKAEPGMQMEAHHYCRIANGDMLQCMIFDGNTREANLIGIEYIISERLFDSLPAHEQGYWHPHNYEVLSGELVAPGMPDLAEKTFFKQLMNSYGKTWHTWHTGRHDGEPGTSLPLGEPKLMWSFNRAGECDESLQRSRDESMGIDATRKHEQRQSLVDLAHPQQGVDTLAGDFDGTEPIPGVVDVHSRDVT